VKSFLKAIGNKENLNKRFPFPMPVLTTRSKSFNEELRRKNSIEVLEMGRMNEKFIGVEKMKKIMAKSKAFFAKVPLSRSLIDKSNASLKIMKNSINSHNVEKEKIIKDSDDRTKSSIIQKSSSVKTKTIISEKYLITKETTKKLQPERRILEKKPEMKPQTKSPDKDKEIKSSTDNKPIKPSKECEKDNNLTEDEQDCEIARQIIIATFICVVGMIIINNYL